MAFYAENLNFFPQKLSATRFLAVWDLDILNSVLAKWEVQLRIMSSEFFHVDFWNREHQRGNDLPSIFEWLVSAELWCWGSVTLICLLQKIEPDYNVNTRKRFPMIECWTMRREKFMQLTGNKLLKGILIELSKCPFCFFRLIFFVFYKFSAF